jgi:AraC-like DNA-binding protein
MITAFLEYAALVLEGRAPAPGGPPDEPSAVTDFSREKVRRAIAYIDENYRYDISREGLACSLGISPYYLGKAFKELTGRKIGDYLNEARVREAARRLSETDETVIDIAFSVGFETLRTFNRAFQRAMNMTPSEYREKHAAGGF